MKRVWIILMMVLLLAGCGTPEPTEPTEPPLGAGPGSHILSYHSDTYNDYLDYRVIGKSEQGRNIYDIILGNPDAKKTMLVVCELHAREYVTSVIAMKQIEYYLKNYNNKVDGTKVSSVFNECNVHYVVMANPDGVVISQNSKPRWKSNANNVNLNNNFRYNFKSMRNDDGSYTGKRYESEKETKAIVKITKELKKQKKFAVVNYHAMGEIVFGDYSGKNIALKRKINA